MADRDVYEAWLLDFIGELYDAAAEPARWPALVLKMARLFDAESCMVLTIDLVANTSKLLGITKNFDGRLLPEYEGFHYREDRWVAGMLRTSGRAVVGREIAANDWYASSKFLNGLWKGAAVHELIGTAVPLGGPVSAVIAIHRPRDAPRFGPSEIARLNLLIPHLKRALQITMRLTGARIDYQAALDGLERTGTAMIVVDHNSTILSANTLGDLLLRRGGSLRSAGGRLTASEPRVADRLTFLIRRATGESAVPGGPGGAVAIDREDGQRPVTVLVAPFRPRMAGFESTLAGALVLVRDASTPAMAADILQDLFGLTRAQATVAALIGEGQDPEHIAIALRVSLYTVRDHLKVIFHKTGTSRQSQLVAMLAPTVAALRSTGADLPNLKSA